MNNSTSDARNTQQYLAALNHLQGEVNTLKAGLSFVLSKQFSIELLARMETFQTVLLNNDAAIAVLRHELSIQTESSGQNGCDASAVSDPERDIQLMSIQITKLKAQLAKYTSAFTNADV